MRVLFSILLSLLVFPVGVLAYEGEQAEALLNRVSFRLSAEQWVTTKTALVTISVNAGVSDIGVEKIQGEVLGKLSKIADQGPWHLIALDRSQDQSGLEKIQITAQARLPSSALSGLRDMAKAMSKPGETFTLDNLQFTPSEDEIRAANIDLRNNIYEQAKEELDRLNKAYPSQKYYIHSIDFLGGALPMPMVQNTFVSVKMAQGVVTKELPVGDKLVLTATVVLASVADQLVAKH
jgi:hypothetical protein